jgi:DNA-binding response OmpR family regulator
MHALIIEDQFLIAALVEEELREIGFTSFDIVDREDAAVAAAAVRCPDLITADENLASGSGIAAVQRICEHVGVPVIFTIGGAAPADLPVPFSAVLSKPFGGGSLREAVARFGHSLMSKRSDLHEKTRRATSAQS